MKLKIKKILPKRLLPRLLIIFFVPLICIQCLAIFLFYDRHWEKITTRFANIASNQVNLIIDDFTKNNLLNKKLLATLNIKFKIQESRIFDGYGIPEGFIQENIFNTLQNRIKQKHKILFHDKEVIIDVFLEENNITLFFPKKYLVSETPIILFLWIISSSILLSLIAFLFMRIQVRAITRLARFSDDSGFGEKSRQFKPEGAVEIRMAGNALIKMKKRMQNHIKNQTSFLAGISHDLGTVITRIKLQLELITKVSEVKDIKDDVISMQTLLNEYLEYSKNIDTSEKLKLLNLKKLLSNLMTDSKKFFRDVNITLNCDSKIKIVYSENNLSRIFSNILNNACKFGKNVLINVQIDKKRFSVNFEDDGPGIPEKMKNKVFTPFFKLDSSRNLNHVGSGLGLSISKQIVSKMGGRISLQKSKLGGSSFAVILPLKK
ncbi:HAMP domain-containing histidine kinase [Rickettsiales bacterium]|nr:HAMP domain-containing histidine kinase [Rickettsiales bacterium]